MLHSQPIIDLARTSMCVAVFHPFIRHIFGSLPWYYEALRLIGMWIVIAWMIDFFDYMWMELAENDRSGIATCESLTASVLFIALLGFGGGESIPWFVYCGLFIPVAVCVFWLMALLELIWITLNCRRRANSVVYKSLAISIGFVGWCSLVGKPPPWYIVCVVFVLLTIATLFVIALFELIWEKLIWSDPPTVATCKTFGIAVLLFFLGLGPLPRYITFLIWTFGIFGVVAWAELLWLKLPWRKRGTKLSSIHTETGAVEKIEPVFPVDET